MSACVHTCLCVLGVHMYLCVSVCTHYTCWCVCVHVFICVCWVCICICVHTCFVCLCACACVCVLCTDMLSVCICAHTSPVFVCASAYMSTCVHLYVCMPTCVSPCLYSAPALGYKSPLAPPHRGAQKAPSRRHREMLGSQTVEGSAIKCMKSTRTNFPAQTKLR